MRSEIENMDANGMNWGVGPYTHYQAIYDKDVEGSTDSTREQQMTTLAKPCFGYWAAYYINRDGGWSVACDALGRVIRCETEKLALSVARYRRRRLQPLPCRLSTRAGLVFAFASDNGLPILKVEDWNGPAGPSAISATRSFAECAGYGGVSSPEGLGPPQ
ncbi:hypothetical protein [Bradyrhizobium tropiciagri]|uniref:hypothetical protein n=1 Tax=Bradyrhizobium tropiciagri TaxID=312253 RepID=UPI00067D502C|nr:hypothetical protein [Bradyrhizobium tropiciagri]